MLPLSHHLPWSAGETRPRSRFSFKNFTKLPSKKAQEIFINHIGLKLGCIFGWLAVLEIFLLRFQKKNQIICYYCLYVHLPRYFCLFCLLCEAYGILVPQPGIKPYPTAVDMQTPNHWTAREFPPNIFKTHVFCFLYWKFNLPFYLTLELRKYLFSKWCQTLETTTKFQLVYIRNL